MLHRRWLRMLKAFRVKLRQQKRALIKRIKALPLSLIRKKPNIKIGKRVHRQSSKKTAEANEQPTYKLSGLEARQPITKPERTVEAPVQKIDQNVENLETPVVAENQLVEKASQFAALNSVEKVVDSMSQREAMKSFIRRMQDELNVQPEELIAAFSKMPSQELMKPPAQAMESFINQLNLSEQQVPQAKLLFQKMLNEDFFELNGGVFTQK